MNAQNAGSLLSQSDIDGGLIGGASLKADAFVTMKNGVKRRCQTTQGWQLLCQWKDGSTNWVALKDMKQSYPVQVAEYARANRIDDEPAFAWWTQFTLRKRDRILAKTKTKYWQRTHKFGLRIPKTVAKLRRLMQRMSTPYGGMQL